MVKINVVKKIQVDLYNSTKMPRTFAKQGDRGTRFVEVELYLNNKRYFIPKEVSAFVNVRKPDKKFCYNECAIKDGLLVVELTNQILAVAGTAYCDIELRREEDMQILSSTTFAIEISESMHDDNAIISSDEVTAFETWIESQRISVEGMAAAANAAAIEAAKVNISAKQIPSGIEVTVTDRDGKDTTIQMEISIASDNELKEMMDDVFETKKGDE